MTERKVVKSCLSECLRYGSSLETEVASGAAVPRVVPDGRKIAPPSQSTHSTPDTWSLAYSGASGGVGYEIKQILSRECATDRSAVFGCSPPIRSCNPLSRDGQFRRCVVINQPDNFFMPDVLPSVKSGLDMFSSALSQV